MRNVIAFSTLVGKTISEINGLEAGSDEVTLTTNDGVYRFYHLQDCCESVSVYDVVGNVADLIGSPVLMAEESANKDENPPKEYSESWTWTFYKLATAKGHVTIRWLGESNGYYSEEVDLVRLT